MKHSRILLIDHDGKDIESVTHSLINLGIGSTVVALSLIHISEPTRPY